MNIGTQQLLYRIDRTAGKFLNGLVVTGIVLATLAGIKVLLVKCGIHFDSPAWSIVLIVYKYLWWSLGGLACICVIGRIVLSPFVKSEEEEDFERKVNFILQQKTAKPQPFSVLSDYSPLCNLLPEQEAQIITLLRNLPPNGNKPEAINLALVSQYLTALEQKGKIKLNDKHALRMWVERTTGKNVPSSSQFNEAIPSKTKSKITAALSEIERILQ